MKIIQESAEHHFLTLLDRLRQDAAGWVGLHFDLSRRLAHGDMIDKPEHIKGKLFKHRKEAEELLQALQARAARFAEAMLYLFSDGDVIMLARPQNEEDRQELAALFREFSEKVGGKLSRYSDLTKDIYEYQKLADAQMLGARRFEAYEAMADVNRLQSIPLRRQRREDSLVLIIEDDRFTASYAANILNKEYEIILAKTGEEAIIHYIKDAPDAVFLDIHLPGLSGTDTLRALRKVDPEAFIVMLSVDTAKDNVVAASKEGAAGFLKKPFSKERMLHLARQSPFVKK